MKKLLLVLTVLLSGMTYLKSQDLTVYKTFDEFEPILHAQDDDVHVINFWATWCAPCVAELPYFDELQEKYASQGVKVTLVSLDFLSMLDSRLKPFLEKRKLKSEVVLMGDPKANSWIDKVNSDWDGTIPATLIYTKDKREFIPHEFESLADIEKYIKPFLKK